MTQKTSISQFSYMRIFGCFGIIILHELFASTVYFKDTMTKNDILFEGIAEHMLMWCVPVFLMITGALLLNPKHEITSKKLFTKYVLRMVITLVSFTLIFQILDTVFGNAGGNIWSEWLKNLVFGTSWAHMWYLYLMIAIYLMIPIFKAVTRSADRWIGYFIGLCLIFLSIVPMLEIFGLHGFALDIPISTIYPVYLFIGYYLFSNKMSMVMALTFTIGCSSIIVMSTIIIIQSSTGLPTSAVYDGIASYSSIFVVGQAAGIFSLMDKLKWKTDLFLKNVDKCTFGIYIIHMIGIRYVFKILEINPYEYGLWVFLWLAGMLFIISLVIVFMFRVVVGVFTNMVKH